MEEHTPRHLRYRPAGPTGTGLKSRAFQRRNALVIAICTAALAGSLAAGVHSAAQGRPTPAVRPGGEQGSAASAGSSASGGAGAVGADLDAQIHGIIDANPKYQIGVALLDLSDSSGADPDVHRYGVEDPFGAASTAKVLAAEAYYHLIETGAASLDDQLGAYPASFQLQAMIQQSDNDSWSLIMNAIGHDELADYAARLGVQYKPESNTLAPADMARILAGLYTGKLLNDADTAQLLSTMQDTNDETLIPAAVPDGINVYHKYGELGGELHDAGILAKDGRACALVVYTKAEDLSSVPERTDIIHQITGVVTDALF